MKTKAKPPALNDDFDIKIGQKIKEARRMRSFTQTDLGNMLGLSFQQIQKYEMGRNQITAKKIYEIAKIFNLPITFFYGDKETSLNWMFSDELKSSGPFFSKEESQLIEAYMRIEDTKLKKAILEMMKLQGRK